MSGSIELKITVKNGKAIADIGRMAKRLRAPRDRNELHRGVIDAGRKTKTQVQRVVKSQMALASGKYQSEVVAHTRGVPRKSILGYEIFSVRRGGPIENYRGLRDLGPGDRGIRKLNAGRLAQDKGTVRSAVWNAPRIFKRSFAWEGDFFAVRPVSQGTRKRPHRALWTYDDRSWQPRSAGGKFASTGRKHGKVRKLYGPALRDELVKDESLERFNRFAPVEMEIQVMKRVEKIMRW